MKRLFKLEQQIGKYGEKLLSRKTPSSAQSNKWIVDEIRTMLDDKMSAHSSKPELTQHFSELFSGLEKINSTQKVPMVDPLDPGHTEAQVMDAFDERYYRGLATFAFTTKVLADKRVKDPQHLMRAVAQGGTILSSWSNSQRQLFRLHVANKLWVLGQRSAARAKLAADYAQIWRERLAKGELSDRDLRLVVRALANTRAVPLAELATDLRANWRSLFVVWQNAFWRLPAEVDAASLMPQEPAPATNPPSHLDGSKLWPALNHVGSKLSSLPDYLNFVPWQARTAPQQIKRALLQHAKATNDDHLVHLLLPLEDDITEAALMAAKIALA